MIVNRHIPLLGLPLFCAVLAGCGLDGMRGVIVSVDGSRYVIRDHEGREHRVHVDENSHRDGAKAGDEVRIFVTKDGYVSYMMAVDSSAARPTASSVCTRSSDTALPDHRAERDC